MFDSWSSSRFQFITLVRRWLVDHLFGVHRSTWLNESCSNVCVINCLVIKYVVIKCQCELMSMINCRVINCPYIEPWSIREESGVSSNVLHSLYSIICNNCIRVQILNCMQLNWRSRRSDAVGSEWDCVKHGDKWITRAGQTKKWVNPTKDRWN
jgi:hypothetical protein